MRFCCLIFDWRFWTTFWPDHPSSAATSFTSLQLGKVDKRIVELTNEWNIFEPWLSKKRCPRLSKLVKHELSMSVRFHPTDRLCKIHPGDVTVGRCGRLCGCGNSSYCHILLILFDSCTNGSFIVFASQHNPRRGPCTKPRYSCCGRKETTEGCRQVTITIMIMTRQSSWGILVKLVMRPI